MDCWLSHLATGRVIIPWEAGVRWAVTMAGSIFGLRRILSRIWRASEEFVLKIYDRRTAMCIITRRVLLGK